MNIFYLYKLKKELEKNIFLYSLHYSISRFIALLICMRPYTILGLLGVHYTHGRIANENDFCQCLHIALWHRNTDSYNRRFPFKMFFPEY